MKFYPKYVQITASIPIENVKKIIESDGTCYIEGTSKIYDGDDCIGSICYTIPEDIEDNHSAISSRNTLREFLNKKKKHRRNKR